MIFEYGQKMKINIPERKKLTGDYRIEIIIFKF